ncbi:hypothetical protein L484_006049 [Morus notabilis]|uniref:Uncharacterized protein n=1 Tax=Morus notabilis TaxID=981085 RepID=W9QI34_9ROSA|nr:hypothetical protein L484_006049 [Morus notabilis]
MKKRKWGRKWRGQEEASVFTGGEGDREIVFVKCELNALMMPAGSHYQRGRTWAVAYWGQLGLGPK